MCVCLCVCVCVCVYVCVRELRQGNILSAATYLTHTDPSQPHTLTHAQHTLRTLLRQPTHHCLLTHTHAQLGTAALPDDRTFQQKVTVYDSPALGAADREKPVGEFVFVFKLAASGCWLISEIDRV